MRLIAAGVALRGDRLRVSAAQAVKTLIHELSHALLHGEGPVPSREVAEVEVESVAYIVCNAIGVASDDYSFPLSVGVEEHARSP